MSATRETASGAASASAAPRNAGLVLTSLILVAAVANLNLSVANVALPSIGAHFDSGQTTLDLIAVGYSLGLACSVYGWVHSETATAGRACCCWGPAGDSDVAPGGVCAERHGSVRRTGRRGAGRGDGVPDHAGVDHRVVGAGRRPDEVDRVVVGHRRRDRRTGPRWRRAYCSSTSTGDRCSCSRSRSPLSQSSWPGDTSPRT